MSKRIGYLKQELTPTFIRHWRIYRGLSQDRLVDRVSEDLPGFSKSTLSRIENAKQPYTQPILEALAVALSCTISDLLTRDPQLDDALATLNALLNKATADERAAALRLVQALLTTVANGRT